jgi:23S rRNA pseudouridine2604 synthase
MKKRQKPMTNSKSQIKLQNAPEYTRINKYIANKGYATRKGADLMIERGLVTINGKKAILGDKVKNDDKVEVKTSQKQSYSYLAYYKPKGVVTTNARGEEKDIADIIHFKTKVFPIGRLDKESYGLILLTNDGRVTDRLLNPIKEHEKEYMITVDRNFTPAFLKHMGNGVNIGDMITHKAKVSPVSNNTFSITLTEGKNRQIKRMTEKLGYTVRDLKRIRVQNILLGNLKPGAYREIVGEELKEFLISIGLDFENLKNNI